MEESREALGVEPICRALQFAPSTYYDWRAIARDPDRASLRAKSDAALSLKIDGAWENNRKLYGARKIWHVLRREGQDVDFRTPRKLDWSQFQQLATWAWINDARNLMITGPLRGWKDLARLRTRSAGLPRQPHTNL
ncbi:MAG: IS3 family transposase [Candidatus Saccharibacteria bacterium]|nr:IS3 family transposase [Pseudorhodobacter sp.]